jgi:hypothetical protein
MVQAEADLHLVAVKAEAAQAAVILEILISFQLFIMRWLLPAEALCLVFLHFLCIGAD